MSNESGSASDQPGLVERIRLGDDAAFGELFQAHETAVRRLARRLVSDSSDAEDITAETFFRVFQAIRRGNGPRDNVRAYLLTVARRVSWEWQAARREVPVTDDELVARAGTGSDSQSRTAESTLVVRAFTSLPERWRTVLWHTEVEGEQPAVVAPHFGLSANATAALARRARIGLRAAYLQAHLATDRSSAGCRRVVCKLGGYTAGSVTGAEAHKISDHLSTCASCRSTHDELLRVSSSLRAHAGAILALVPLSGLALAGSGAYAGAGVAVAASGSATVSGVAAGSGTGAGAAIATAFSGSKLGLTFASAAAVVGMSGAPMLDDIDSRRAQVSMPGGDAVVVSSSATDDERSSRGGLDAAVGHPAKGRDGTGSTTLPAESAESAAGPQGPTDFTLPAETEFAADADSPAAVPGGPAADGVVPGGGVPSRGPGFSDETRQGPGGGPRDDTGAGAGGSSVTEPTQRPKVDPPAHAGRPSDTTTGPPPWAGPPSWAGPKDRPEGGPQSDTGPRRPGSERTGADF